MSELKPSEAIEILESIYPSKRQIVTGEYPDVAEALDLAINTLRHAQPDNEPLTRCENCTHWDKSISFMMSAHACSYWSPSKRSPRYTEGFEFCSFASAKPERSEGE